MVAVESAELNPVLIFTPFSVSDSSPPLAMPMPVSSVRKKIASGEPIICAKASYQDPAVVELIGTFGFDAIWVCLEHKKMDPAAVYAYIQACRLNGVDALMRVKPGNYTDLLWLLESGARGLMLPRVRHVDEARELVDAMKFPPVGRRGYDGVHAESNFGHMSPADYIRDANRENYLVVQIEEPEVVPHIEAIAALPGADILFVGPGDLTLGLGKFGQIDDPEVTAILRQVTAACKRHGKVAAIPCAPDQVKKFYDMGFRFFNVISDFRSVFNGMKKAQADVSAFTSTLKPPAKP